MIYRSHNSAGNRTHIRNLLPSAYPTIGPFIFLDHIGPNTVPAGQQIRVPAHPHAGIETISYLFEGTGFHQDSLGYNQPLEPGRLNWMTAGSGIVHAEGSGRVLTQPVTIHGVQIWTYLPAAQQLEKPYFQTFAQAELPAIWLTDQSFIRVLAGRFGDHEAPVRLVRRLQLLHVHLAGGESVTLPVDEGFQAGVYLCNGSAHINHEQVDATGLVVDNTQFILTATTDSNLILLAGEPINEPRYAYGPFVMTDSKAVQAAIGRYERGEMGHISEPEPVL